MLFFILTMTILVGLISWKEAGIIESPFVVVFDKIGIPYAADIMNFVIITALLSVANSGYMQQRVYYGHLQMKMHQTYFKKVNKRGIPITAVGCNNCCCGVIFINKLPCRRYSIYVLIIYSWFICCFKLDHYCFITTSLLMKVSI